MHVCNCYCLDHQKRWTKTKDNIDENNTGKRKFSDTVTGDKKGKIQHKRFCRFCAGREETAWKGGTPGFECNTSTTITGNVDVKNLLYQSDPNNTNPEDIVSCTDYMVGYQMKGARTLAIEGKNMNDFVMNMEDLHGDKMRI
jgi:hypothetical protein